MIKIDKKRVIVILLLFSLILFFRFAKNVDAQTTGSIDVTTIDAIRGVSQSTGFGLSGVTIFLDDVYVGNTNSLGKLIISNVVAGNHKIRAFKEESNFKYPWRWETTWGHMKYDGLIDVNVQSGTTAAISLYLGVQCEDTDGVYGTSFTNDIYKKGILTYKYKDYDSQSIKIITYTDYCNSATSIEEYACYNLDFPPVINNENDNCPSGYSCCDGACSQNCPKLPYTSSSRGTKIVQASPSQDSSSKWIIIFLLIGIIGYFLAFSMHKKK